MSWFYLIVAGILEVLWAFFMKQSHGFSELVPSLLTLIFMIISFFFLALAMKSLPLGISYIIWTGIGALGSFLVGVLLMGEPISVLRIISLIFIMTGLILMKISSH